MSPTDPKTPTEKPTDDRTDRQPTDGVPLLAAAVASREILQDVDPATVDDDQESRLINALEALDNLYIEAPSEELTAALDADVDGNADATGDSPMTDESTEITIESNAETVPADDLEIDLENADDPLNELRAAIAERDEPAWNVTTLVEIDPETAERFRPAFKQAIADPDEQFLDLIDNYAATDAQVTINGYDPEYYFENISERFRDRNLTMAVINALDEADEPLDWDELVAATGIDEATLDSKIMALQDRDIVRVRGREPDGYILVNKEDRGNNDV